MSRYQLDIIVRGLDRASTPLGRISRSLRRVGRIASGILVANVIGGLAQQIKGLASTAIDSFTSLERMEVSVQSLIARELSRGEVVTTTSTTIRELTEKEALQLDKLRLSHFELTQEIEEAQSKYNAMVAEFGEGSVEALSASVALRELQQELGEVSGEISSLEKLDGQLIEITSAARVGVMDMAEALESAEGPAKRLTRWVQELAIFSPFKEQDIVAAFRTSAAYGFVTQFAADAATEQEALQRAQEAGVVTAQRLTQAMVNLVAGTGLPPENIRSIAVALGQVQAKGRLAAQEIHQLINAGIGVEMIAFSMGLTVEEFQKLQDEGKILADDVLPALVSTIERDFAGAAGRVMNTLGGTFLALEGVIRVLLRDFFGPTFKALLPALQQIFQTLAASEFRDKTVAAGEKFAASLMRGAESAKQIYNFLRELQGLSLSEIVFDVPKEFLPEQAVAQLEDVERTVDNIATADLGFQAGNLEAFGGALTGVGAVLGGRAFVSVLPSLGTTLLKVLSSFNVTTFGIIAAGALLGAAWQGDWLGIRTTLTQAWEVDIQPALAGLKTWLMEEGPPAVTNFVGYVRGELIPSIVQFGSELEQKATAGLNSFILLVSGGFAESVETVISLWETRLIPAWSTARDTLQGVVGFINEHTGGIQAYTEAVIAAQEPSTTLFTNIFGDLVEFSKTELIPMWSNLASWVGEKFLGEAEQTGLWFTEGLLPTLGTLYNILDENVLPIISNFVGVITDIRDIAGVAVQQVWDDVLFPIYSNLATFLSEDVIPTVQSFVDVLVAIKEKAGEAFRGFWQKIVLPALQNFANVVSENINPALTGFRNFLSFIKESVEILMPILTSNISAVLEPFAGALDKIGGALEGVRGWLDKVAEAIENMELPWWLTPGSPTPFELGLVGINNQLKKMSGLMHGTLNSPFGTKSQFGGGVMAGSGSVYVEGDTFQMSVKDSATAELVSTLILQRKRERLDALMGGR